MTILIVLFVSTDSIQHLGDILDLIQQALVNAFTQKATSKTATNGLLKLKHRLNNTVVAIGHLDTVNTKLAALQTTFEFLHDGNTGVDNRNAPILAFGVPNHFDFQVVRIVVQSFDAFLSLEMYMSIRRTRNSPVKIQITVFE